MTLHVEHYGKTGPQLVLLHGWGLSSAIWQTLIEALAPHYRLTLVDLPGLGRSSELAETSLVSMVDAIVAEVPQGAIWIGWSLGGSVALAAAAAAPERVRALVMIASNPCFVQRDNWPCAMPATTFDAFVGGLSDDPGKTLNRFALLQTQGSASARQELRLLKRVIAESDAKPSGLSATLELLREDARAYLQRASQPTLLVLGERDPLVPMAVAEHITGLRDDLVIRRYATAAHLPFVNDPERFLADLDGFVAGVLS
ncbi:Biotin synthesis protein BioH [Marinobacterium lacunae]|uniref:Pimeloyl-[acyl-carrier protein] methyl ester esterase n=1 Tax=Marinobacterium lacunae TaxID=1232683 RepID=A0A081G3W1_9GAMM|nr:pimeloyl-ACP methyl ester esterase BioH [Marinobacterium lacunae]KEA65466.1 Biotin synthesis protein BioH [Marinobacterium lacunae]